MWCCRRFHLTRGRRVEAGQYEASQAGCRGLSPFAQLPYVSLSTLFLLPVSHLLLLGLAKGLWRLALRTLAKGDPRPPFVLSGRTRRTINARCGHIRPTSDFGRSTRWGSPRVSSKLLALNH